MYLVEVLLYINRNRRFIGDGKPRTSTSTFTQNSLSSLLLFSFCLGYKQVFYRAGKTSENVRTGEGVGGGGGEGGGWVAAKHLGLT